MIDKESKCHLTYRDLQPVLKVAGVESDQEQLQYFLQVDRDGSGQIEFPEFIELLSILGFSLGKTALAKKKREIENNLDKLYNMIDDIFDKEKSATTSRGIHLPDTVVALALEKEGRVAGVGGSIAEKGAGSYFATSIVKPNRSAIERKSYRIQSKKVDKSRLMASFSKEPGGSHVAGGGSHVASGGSHVGAGGHKPNTSYDDEMRAIREEINKKYGTNKNESLGHSNNVANVANAVSQFQEMAYEADIRPKPRAIVLNYSKANTKVVPSTELVLQDEEL